MPPKKFKMDLILLKQLILLNNSLENTVLIQNSPFLKQCQEYIRNLMTHTALLPSTLSKLNLQLTAGYLTMRNLSEVDYAREHFYGQYESITPSIMKGFQVQKIQQLEHLKEKVRL